MPIHGVVIARGTPADHRPALELLYQKVDLRWRSEVVDLARRQVEAGEIDLSNLWIARRGRRIVGAMIAQRLPGGAAALWPPEVAPGWGRAAAALQLVETAVRDLEAEGVRLVQALLDPGADSERPSADLDRGGVPAVTTLVYLERSTEREIPAPLGPTGLEWLEFRESRLDDFRRILDRTYEGSLDMPELEGARSLDDILEGHRASGRFDPARWRLGRADGDREPTAILLMADVPDKSAWEISYFGLAPEARGRGLGLAALEHARRLARPRVDRLELAVDVRNRPAERLYHAAGFLPYDRKSVHLKVLRLG